MTAFALGTVPINSLVLPFKWFSFNCKGYKNLVHLIYVYQSSSMVGMVNSNLYIKLAFSKFEMLECCIIEFYFVGKLNNV